MSAAPRTILLVGANGQVGWELRRSLAPLGHVVAHDRSTLDLADHDAIGRIVAAANPGIIVNAAAYTQVDRAESEPALAQRINAEAPGVLARAARECGAVMVHYSTDYVFDGAASVPYRESDVTNPLNVYGRSKRDGDAATLESGAMAFIFRVGWVYGRRGANFLHAVRRLLSEGRELRIVADQFGSPTWSRAIADATADALGRIVVAKPAPGVYHMAAPDHTSWAGFAQAITGAQGATQSVKSITTAEYPTPARRPRWSVLDSTLLRTTFGIELAPWREQLAACLAESPAVVS